MEKNPSSSPVRTSRRTKGSHQWRVQKFVKRVGHKRDRPNPSLMACQIKRLEVSKPVDALENVTGNIWGRLELIFRFHIDIFWKWLRGPTRLPSLAALDAPTHPSIYFLGSVVASINSSVDPDSNNVSHDSQRATPACWEAFYSKNASKSLLLWAHKPFFDQALDRLEIDHDGPLMNSVTVTRPRWIE